jgi:hypothetical protein
MTKSKQSLRNLARCALLLNLTLLFFLVPGCEFETEYTYLTENVPAAIQDISKNEYKMDVRAKMVGSTIWIYVPLEEMFAPPDKAKKPEKYIEHFAVEQCNGALANKTLDLDYLIRLVPETEKSQNFILSKDAYMKQQYIWQIMVRMLMSVKPQKSGGIQFFSVVYADIKNGFLVRNIYYYADIKKALYNLISQTEFQHRTVQDWQVTPQVIADKTGVNIKYTDITMDEFIAWQIINRIRIKFQKPEVPRNVDIDREIEKIITYTVKAYDFNDFNDVKMNNLLTNKKMQINRAAIMATPTE